MVMEMVKTEVGENLDELWEFPCRFSPKQLSEVMKTGKIENLFSLSPQGTHHLFVETSIFKYLIIAL